MPHAVYTDDGKEFKGVVDKYFKETDVRHIVMKTDLKCVLVERLNRSIKSRLYKVFTYRNNLNYIDILPDVMKAINTRINPTTGRAPDSVGPFTNLYVMPTPSVEPKFAVGAFVRVSRFRRPFDKGHRMGYTAEYFKVYVHFRRCHPPTIYVTYSTRMFPGFLWQRINTCRRTRRRIV